MQARRGELVDVLAGDGLVSEAGGELLGLVTWVVAAAANGEPGDGAAIAEIRALAVAGPMRGRGVGRALLLAAEDVLRRAGVPEGWLVTTNDNLVALELYQKAGWRLSELRAGAIDQLRRSIKPGIPAVGQHGIPLRDELELTKEL
jgi:GNAT superfamily N-acetyltransferase